MIDKPLVLSVRVTEAEYEAFMVLCMKHNLSRQELLRAMIVDALLDEADDAIRRKQSERHKGSSETGEGCRPAT
jgi:hypothetical protein